MRCLNYFQQVGFKWINPKEYDSKKYSNDSSKGCVLEANFEYPKELRELHNDYLLAPHKIEVKREVLSNYQLKLLIFTIF